MIYYLGLIGYPVSHSLSPKLQGAALRAAGLEGEYRLYPIDPAFPELLKETLERVRAGEIQGLNVTIPHKQTVIPLLDELTPVAGTIGAVNVIYRQGNRLIGDNTDAGGFLTDLKNFLGNETYPEKSALVLGAGGSARAVVYALRQDGWKISICARRIEQAQTLIDQNNAACRQNDMNLLENLFSLETRISLVVNTTPVGMIPHLDVSPWIAELPFPVGASVYDLIYNPGETLLVKQARAAGLRATTGLGMLVEQALLGFKIWTGHSVAREILFSAVEA